MTLPDVEEVAVFPASPQGGEIVWHTGKETAFMYSNAAGEWIDISNADGILGAHSSSHENGGTDEINVEGLSGLLADPQTPAAHTHTHASTTGQTPNDHHSEDHAARHSSGGDDQVSVENLNTISTETAHVFAPDGDNTASFKALGALPTVANVMQVAASIQDHPLSGTYETVFDFIYDGSNEWGTIIEILILHRQDGGAGKFHNIRIIDATNGGVTIAEGNNFSNTVGQIDSLTLTPANIPTGQARFELQVRSNGASHKVFINTFTMQT